MIIRAETAADIAAIHRVNELAFGQAAEARLVDALRGSEWWIPELSMVVEEDGAVIAHILFSHVVVRDGDRVARALALAPVAVLPERQSAGVGSRLIRTALERARQLGHGVIILLGHPAYYPRFGFVPAGEHGIRYPQPGHEAAFMVAELIPGSLAGVRGVVEYAPPFSAF